MIEFIYHVVRPEWWEKYEGQSTYVSETFNEEGFIHCSTVEQIIPTCYRYFGDMNEVVVLELDVTKLHSKVAYEYSNEMGEEFPHIYGTINLDSISQLMLAWRNDYEEFELKDL